MPDGHTKTDEFSERFQTAFDPIPSFSENRVAIFFFNFHALNTGNEIVVPYQI